MDLDLIVKGIEVTAKAIGKHLKENKKTYIVAGGGVAASGVAYATGKKSGKIEGKKEGTIEQAARDEKKIKKMHQKHEKDRKHWNEMKQAYENLLDKVADKL